jgi:hypothetical protein
VIESAARADTDTRVHGRLWELVGHDVVVRRVARPGGLHPPRVWATCTGRLERAEILRGGGWLLTLDGAGLDGGGELVVVGGRLFPSWMITRTEYALLLPTLIYPDAAGLH